MKGGFLYRPFIKHSLKLSIDTLKNIFQIIQKIIDEIDKYHFGYMIIDNINNLC